jgi:hypothetical protein
MVAIANSKIVLDRRIEERSSKETFIRLRTLDDLNECNINALILDISGSGATVLSHIPLPVSTKVVIDLDEITSAIAEVVYWQWDYHIDIARLGVRFIEKKNWPLLTVFK